MDPRGSVGRRGCVVGQLAMAVGQATHVLPGPAEAGPGERARARIVSATAGPLVFTVGLVALVQLIVAGGVISEDSVPLPTDVASSFTSAVRTSAFWEASRDTVLGWALGLAAATVIAIPLGILAGTNEVVLRSLRIVIDFFRPIPSVALLPLVVLLIGIEMQAKVVLAGISSFFPLLFATLYGIQDVDAVTRETATSYRIGGLYRFFSVSLPSAAPYIATGLRISASVALLITVGTEMIVGLPGLGLLISQAQSAGDRPLMYAMVVASGMLGITVAAAFVGLERRLLRWHPSQIRGGR